MIMTIPSKIELRTAISYPFVDNRQRQELSITNHNNCNRNNESFLDIEKDDENDDEMTIQMTTRIIMMTKRLIRIMIHIGHYHNCGYHLQLNLTKHNSNHHHHYHYNRYHHHHNQSY